MDCYMAVYSRNELITLAVISEDLCESVQAHDSGFLIYAKIKADSYEQAHAIAVQIGRDYDKKRNLRME